MMLSGIMYVSGRERSLRASAEFACALGANVGAAMILREGTGVVKFFPGWGNIVCGLVAGSGTYAIGRAATVVLYRRCLTKGCASHVSEEPEKTPSAGSSQEAQ